MKKINILKIELIVLVLSLFVIPFTASYDFDGDGIDDGEQDLCGDGYCQDWEDITSCSLDCFEDDASPGGSLCGNAICEPDEDITSCPDDCVKDATPSLEEKGISDKIKEVSFVSSLAFKIIIVVIVLIIVGMIVFIIYRKKMSNRISEENQSGESFVQV